MKTSELTGATLNWAVATIMGLDIEIKYGVVHVDDDELFMADLDWGIVGTIIEQEGMGIWMYQWDEEGEPEVGWYAEDKDGNHVRTGPDPRIAALRCYVASKLGDTIDIPEELK